MGSNHSSVSSSSSPCISPTFSEQEGCICLLDKKLMHAQKMENAEGKQSAVTFDVSIFEDGRKRVCLVCSDLASGLHYGVASCEACKAFFKRTIQGNIDYTCPAKERCEINKRRRKACQACRFRKCLDVGMLREGVRLDRVRGGRQKYRRLSSSSLGSPDIKRFYTDSSHLIKTMVEIEPALVEGSPDVSIDDFKLQYTSLLSDIADRELVSTIGWARLVPGFDDLDLTDQMCLLQSCWLDIRLVNLAFRSCPYTVSLKFSSGFSVSTEQTDIYGVPAKLDNLCRRLATRLTHMELTQEEFVVLKGILLFNTDCSVLDKKSVQSLREAFYKALDNCCRRSHHPHPSCKMADILTVLQTVTKIKLMAVGYWNEVKNSGSVQLHKLFLEMLEVD